MTDDNPESTNQGKVRTNDDGYGGSMDQANEGPRNQGDERSRAPRDDQSAAAENAQDFAPPLVSDGSRSPQGSRNRGVVWVLAALLIIVFLVSSRPTPPPPGWKTDLAAARAEAKADGKLVLVSFTLPGCAPCKQMKRTTLVSEVVVKSLADFVPVEVDLGQSLEAARQYQVSAAPTYVATKPDGTPLGRTMGFMEEPAFVMFLSSAKAQAQSSTGR
jgi:thioredoxin-related protein